MPGGTLSCFWTRPARTTASSSRSRPSTRTGRHRRAEDRHPAIARRGGAALGTTPADALREAPPHEFVRARNALAARLAKSGKTAEARRVARLRRPSPVVWALNHAATSRAHELRALIEAVDRLRRAQLGRGDPRAATEQYRTALEPLVRDASQALRDAAVRVSPALDRRIRSTLLAAVTDRGLRADLEAGRLAEEHPDPGFAVLSRGPVPAAFLRERPKRPAAAPAHPTSAPAMRPSSSAAQSRKMAREQARAARAAVRETKGLETRARRSERAAQAAERRLEAMRRDLQALEQRTAALKAAAAAARNALAANVGRSPRTG